MFNFVFRILLVSRCLSAIFSNIQDCDEVFNYWEPSHYLQYGIGLQTWEYAPEYSIRSWAYILLHSTLSLAFELTIAQSKIQVFYFTRFILATSSAYAEATLCDAIAKHVHPRVAIYSLIFLFFSPGLFIASTAFLPSTFAMYTSTLAFALLLSPKSRWNTWQYVCWTSLGAFWGWPFAAALALPFIADSLLLSNQRWTELRRMAEGTLVAFFSVLAPLLLIDYYFYKKWVFASLNIVLYNVFGKDGRGPDIYGVEPWWFYIANGLINFNLIYMAALLSIPVTGFALLFVPKVIGNMASVKFHASKLIVRLGAFYLWFAIFTAQPHKEERFMYVVFPIICFCAAVFLYILSGILESILKTVKGLKPFASKLSQCVVVVFIALSVALSVLRITANYKHFHAPLDIYRNLIVAPLPFTNGQPRFNTTITHAVELKRPLVVCVGQEWYRFPSHYFLPTGMTLGFLKTSFTGQLPQYFAQNKTEAAMLMEILAKSGSSGYTIDSFLVAQRHLTRSFNLYGRSFNDVNREELDRYTDTNECDYLVELITPSEWNKHPENTKMWHQVSCIPFLDSSKTPWIQRVLYVPGQRAWFEYCLFVRK